MTSPRSALFLVALLVVAGCVGIGSPPVGQDEQRSAVVTRVIDGDTVTVRYAEGGTDTVRLLGVDSPEVDGRNDPEEFEGVPDTDAGRTCLQGAAHESTEFTERHSAGANVSVVVDGTADRRDRYDRLLAYIVLANGANLNYHLVDSGHARVYDSTFSQSDRFYAAESAAQTESRGLWRCRDPLRAHGDADSPLVVAAVHADAEGDDHTNLGDEYVVFLNPGDDPIDLTGWTVRDEAGHDYPFPHGFVLSPGANVTLVSGSGTDSSDTLYWGADEAIWNNDGDTVIVTNATESVVLRYTY